MITRCCLMPVPSAAIPAMPGDLERVPGPVSAAASSAGAAVLAGELLGPAAAESSGRCHHKSLPVRVNRLRLSPAYLSPRAYIGLVELPRNRASYLHRLHRAR